MVQGQQGLVCTILRNRPFIFQFLMGIYSLGQQRLGSVGCTYGRNETLFELYSLGDCECMGVWHSRQIRLFSLFLWNQESGMWEFQLASVSVTLSCIWYFCISMYTSWYIQINFRTLKWCYYMCCLFIRALRAFAQLSEVAHWHKVSCRTTPQNVERLLLHICTSKFNDAMLYTLVN